MTAIFRWDGRYFGFIHGGNLFDAAGSYLGWSDGEWVWRADGTFLGEVVDDDHILRNETQVEPVPQVPRVPPVPPVPPIPEIDRVGRVPLAGWKDALEDFE